MKKVIDLKEERDRRAGVVNGESEIGLARRGGETKVELHFMQHGFRVFFTAAEAAELARLLIVYTDAARKENGR